MKKSIVLAVMTLMLTGALASSTYAQEWPQKPIRVIVSFGPGGGADIIGRILADSMQAQLGKPMVVENKPGAGGIIGNEAVANADPDGYTLGIMTAGQIIAAVTRKNMRYDTLTAFAPIGPSLLPEDGVEIEAAQHGQHQHAHDQHQHDREGRAHRPVLRIGEGDLDIMRDRNDGLPTQNLCFGNGADGEDESQQPTKCGPLQKCRNSRGVGASGVHHVII